MKARVKHNNEIIDVVQVGTKSHLYDLNNIEFIDAPEDYWTRLEHQYAGMAMQAIVTNCGSHDYASELDELLVTPCIEIAHALVEKLKEKEERK